MPSQFPLSLACLLLLTVPISAQGNGRTDQRVVQQLLEAEDARGTTAAGIAPILSALASPDPLVRRVAARATGRLQRPNLGHALVPLLSDRDAGVRREAANGIVQSLNRVRRGAGGPDTTNISVSTAQAILAEHLTREREPAVIDAITRSLGRMPYGNALEARAAEGAILATIRGTARREQVQGLYRLAMARRTTGVLTHGAVLTLRQAVLASPDATARRLAMVTLGLTTGHDSSVVMTALRDRDDQVRKHGLEGIAILSPPERDAAIRAGLRDPSAVVRIAAIGAARALSRTPSCAGIIPMLDDPTPMVTVAAANALGSPCADSVNAIAALERVIATPPTSGPIDHRWQRGATALQSLARISASRAQPYLARFAASPRIGERIAAATVAGTLNEETTLRRLATDPDHNVQESAITALARTAKHAADSIYVAALSSAAIRSYLPQPPLSAAPRTTGR